MMQASRRKAFARRTVVVATAGAALFAGGAVGLGKSGVADSPSTASAGTDAEVVRLSTRLTQQPGDHRGWAQLGDAYLEQARNTENPALYPDAEAAYHRSLELRPADNIAAMIGMGSLANARHDFQGGLRWARKALRVSEHNPGVYGVLADAHTQLGQPNRATAAVQRMLDLSPSLPALTRGSFDLEQRGRVTEAEALLERALRDTHRASDIAFCRYYLGELARSSGRLAEAQRHFVAGLVVAPNHLPLLQGSAKVAALRGDLDAALRQYADLVARAPDADHLVEYGELLARAGQRQAAADQFAKAATALAAPPADGQATEELEQARFEAEYGSPAKAVAHGRAEWARNPNAVTADALAWALHRAGQQAEALRYADKALAEGWRNALFLHHRSEIRRALGDDRAAAADARLARTYNPAFDPTLPSFWRAA